MTPEILNTASIIVSLLALIVALIVISRNN